MRRAGLSPGIALLLAACAAGACRREPPPAEEALDSPSAPTPDRLGPGEQLPESETAFGLPLPPGMRLERQFKATAYFGGNVEVQRALEYLAEHVTPSNAQLVASGADFPSVRVKGDTSGRLLHIALRKTSRGSQVQVEDITPPAPITGLTKEEIWRKAGRNPDGTPIDPNQLY